MGSLPSDAHFLPRHQIPNAPTVGSELSTQIHKAAFREKGGGVLRVKPHKAASQNIRPLV